MKIKPEHLAHLRHALEPCDTEAARCAYAQQGLSDKRYRWDLLYAAGLSKWICDNLYSYLDDTHIDTALRSLVKQLPQP